jgi:TRAP-type uncharacterized transport system fused permease subunit
VVVLEATRRTYGLALPIWRSWPAYAFLGTYLPGLHTAYQKPGMIISRLSVGISGIYGVVLGISVTISLFIVFGALLQAVGPNNFFLQVGRVFWQKAQGWTSPCGSLLFTPYGNGNRWTYGQCGCGGHFHHTADEADRL